MNTIVQHWDIVREALAAERTKTRKLWDADATAFLPAVMEVTERPVSPTARWSARVLLAGLLATILWLVLGQVDIVASAPGKLVPADNVKLIQPAEAGIVRAILVRDGQKVRKGQVLVELDPTVSTADVAQAEKSLEMAELDAARANAILSALDGHEFALQAPAGTSADVYTTQLALARSRLAQILASASTHTADVSAAQAARSEASIQAAKLTETLPLLDQQIEANEKLLAKGFVSKLRVIEMRRQRLAAARDRDVAMETIRRAEAQIASAKGGHAQARAEARAQVLSDLTKAETEMKIRREELAKARQRSSLQRITAPEDGIVAQLSVHTIGGVVEPAKRIMVVVPSTSPIELDAKIINRDIGFIAVGQTATIKLDAFPFTRFGTISGRVISIDPDAEEDERFGLYYPVRIAIPYDTATNQIDRDALVPGMTAIADIRTGKRTVLSFLIGPLEGIISSAGRER